MNTVNVRIVTETTFSVDTEDLSENATEQEILNHFHYYLSFGKRDIVMSTYSDKEGKVIVKQINHTENTHIES